MNPAKLLRFRGRISGGASGRWWYEADGECLEVRGIVESSTMKLPGLLYITISGELFRLASAQALPPRIDAGEEIILYGSGDLKHIVGFQIIKEGRVAFRCVLFSERFSNYSHCFMFEDEGSPAEP